jgi:DNA-binding beta-propeller fold protein YncE/peroxiredoxin
MVRALMALVLATPLACAPAAPSSGPPPQVAEERESSRPLARELEGGSAWFNTDRPLRLADLRGHVVVVDFWTYACVNCLHTLPELAALERRFGDRPVVVIGVHSGKFDAEKDGHRIELAMARHGVAHPVVVDSDFTIWNRFGVTAWPTLAVIDPEGRIAAQESGEPDPGALSALVESLLERGAAAGTLASQRVAIRAPERLDTGPLAFPGKVAVSPSGQIALADSGHHRVVLLDADGRFEAVVGSGIAGSADGDANQAAFHYPQGLTFDDSGQRLFVADTNNHQLRAIDVASRNVTTLAGTGERGRASSGGAAKTVALRSPWDLAYRDGELFVAMAGAHQIWRYDFARDHIAPFAGTGAERIDDGPATEATFSQPSGLTLLGDTLFVADAEVSAIRAVDLATGAVSTLVGKGLFDFGDVDGKAGAVRLQHALAVTARGDQLYIADTFNNKIKQLDPATRSVVTAVGGATEQLFEPGGLAAASDGSLLVADTNNHRLRRFDPASGTLTTLSLEGLEPPATRGLVLAKQSRTGRATGDQDRLMAAGRLGPGRGTLIVDIAPPLGGKLTDGAPLSVLASSSGKGLAFPQPKMRAKFGKDESGKDALPLRLPIDVAPDADGSALIELAYFWCTTSDAGACIPVHATLEVALDLQGDGPGGEARIQHRAAPEE